MTRATLLLALAAPLMLAGCIGLDADNPAPAESPDADAAETTWFEKVHTPEEIQDRLAAYDRLDRVTVDTIGTSFEDRPIDKVTVGSGPFHVWMTGRMHGDEPTGGEAILLAIETLAEPDAKLPDDAPPIVHDLREHRDEILDRLTLHLVPVANPDGAAAYQRETALNVDPNRDNYLFTQPSTQALREAFWDATPHACLDLHNMGEGSTDFDAYGPEGPLMEDEPYERMRTNADRSVREVDAAGGNAGAFNENYRAPEPADDHPNPTAFHPGTHDMFCTARGAPAWTPEGAIPSGENGIDTHPFEWSTRLHLVTLAASALDWAGAYDATQPRVATTGGTTGTVAEQQITVHEADHVLFQAIWRQTNQLGDHNPLPTRFTVTTPDGTEHEGREPLPEAWTSTVTLEDPEPGDYTLSFTSPPGIFHQIRTIQTAPATPLVDVQRSQDTLTMEALDDAPGTVHVRLSDIADPPDGTPSASQGTLDVFAMNGTTGERTLASVHADIEPGQQLTLSLPPTWENPGPYRFTASAGDVLHAGIEDARNPG